MLRVNRGVILAAGDGDRLGYLTATIPKVLLPINDKPLIAYPIEALAAAGISEIAIVVGYLGDKVVEVLGSGSNFGVRLNYFFNPDYLGGNAISLYKARDWTQGQPVVVCMGDHLIERRLIKRLVHRASLTETLCVDCIMRHQLAEATKVTVNSVGCIGDIGKGLGHWDAVDTGVFLLTQHFFEALAELIPRLGTDIEISDVVLFLLSRGHRFHTCDVSGCFWLDVDTEADLNRARQRWKLLTTATFPNT